MDKRIKVLIVDDSAVVRHVLKDGLSTDPEIVVVGTAQDPFDAAKKIEELRPDVVTLDVTMPKMDGIEFLRQLLPQYPVPVIMISAATDKGSRITMQALEVGAVDFLTKAKGDVRAGLHSMLFNLKSKIKVAATINVDKMMHSLFSTESRVQAATGLDLKKVIAFGVSTGGFETVKYILKSLPRTMPGILITQHMPPGYTKTYAERLNDATPLTVVEGKTGDEITPGKVIVAPGGFQMEVEGKDRYFIRCDRQDKVSGHCPSVDVLFESMSRCVRDDGIGVILTGMGEDGADGLLTMRRNGAYTLAQDKDSCVVFGMPKVAIERGAAEGVVPLEKIPDVLISLLTKEQS